MSPVKPGKPVIKAQLVTLSRFVMDCLVFLAGKSARGGLTLSEMLDRLGEEMASPNLACPLDLVSPWAGPNGAYTRLDREPSNCYHELFSAGQGGWRLRQQ